MPENTLELQSMSLNEIGTKKFAELHYATSWPVEADAPYVMIRLPIENKFPPLPAAAREALTNVRSLIQNEIQRFDKMHSPSL